MRSAGKAPAPVTMAWVLVRRLMRRTVMGLMTVMMHLRRGLGQVPHQGDPVALLQVACIEGTPRQDNQVADVLVILIRADYLHVLRFAEYKPFATI